MMVGMLLFVLPGPLLKMIGCNAINGDDSRWKYLLTSSH